MKSKRSANQSATQTALFRLMADRIPGVVWSVDSDLRFTWSFGAGLEALGLHAVIGGITLPNPSSVALHEKMGMEKVAHFPEVGFKQGQWLDVGYWQLCFPRRSDT